MCFVFMWKYLKNNRMKINKNICFIVVASLLSSCFSDLDIAPQSGYPVCVKCILNNESGVQKLEMVYARPIYEKSDDYIAVTDASAVLYDISSGIKSEVARFKHKDGSEWETLFEPICGARYRLEIEVPGKKTISSELTYPKKLVVFLLRVYSKTELGNAYFFLSAGSAMKIPEFPIPDINHYRENLEILHQQGRKDLSELYPGTLYRVECDEDVNLLVHAMNLWKPLFYEKQPSFATDLTDVRDITIGGEQAFYSAADSSSNVYPYPWFDFKNPVYSPFLLARVPKDFSNGIESAALMYRESILHFSNHMENYPNVNKFFRIMPLLYNYDKESGEAPYYPNAYSPDRISFWSITDDFEKYITTTWNVNLGKDERVTNILDKLYSGDDTFTNINGGYGVFGAYYLTYPLCEIDNRDSLGYYGPFIM